MTASVETFLVANRSDGVDALEPLQKEFVDTAS